MRGHASIAAAAMLVFTLPGAAAPSPRQKAAAVQYVSIAQLGLAVRPIVACTGSCATKADRERTKLGPPPTLPLYRPSATQATAERDQLLNAAAAQGTSKKDASDLVLPQEKVLSMWADAWPKGQYRSDDLGDVLAKYWLYSWAIGYGADPSKVSETMQAGVRGQMHRLIVSDPVIAGFSEAERQALADMLMRAQAVSYLAMMMTAGIDDTAARNQQLDAGMQHIADRFRGEFSVDLAKLALTPDQGFARQEP